METKRVLVTGGTGFVGYWFDKMKPPGYAVTCLNHYGYELRKWAGTEWDYIVHLANISPREVIDCALWNGARVLQASSGAVYHQNKNEYGVNKVRWENELHQSGVNHIIARLFTFTGARLQWGGFAIGNFIQDAVKGSPIRILGSGETVRSYMYGSDLGDWLWALLLDSVQGVYDVGSPNGVTMRQLAREIAQRFDPQPEIKVLNQMEFERAPVYLPTINPYLSNYLGLRLKVQFDQAIDRSIEDYRHEN